MLRAQWRFRFHSFLPALIYWYGRERVCSCLRLGKSIFGRLLLHLRTSFGCSEVSSSEMQRTYKWMVNLRWQLNIFYVNHTKFNYKSPAQFVKINTQYRQLIFLKFTLSIRWWNRSCFSLIIQSRRDKISSLYCEFLIVAYKCGFRWIIVEIIQWLMQFRLKKCNDTGF